MTEIRNSIFAGLAFAILFGTYLLVVYGAEYALIGGPLSGLFFGLGMYWFVKSKTYKNQTKIQTSNNTDIIHSGSANHFVNFEGVGGKLYLLKDTLQFKSHNFNLQNHETVIALNNIKEIGFYNSLGIVPNGLAVTTKDGKTEKFVVNGRKTWKEKIETQISR